LSGVAPDNTWIL